MESAFFIRSGRLVDLSVQQLIDCSPNWGCLCGYMKNAYDYLVTHPMLPAADYPFMNWT